MDARRVESITDALTKLANRRKLHTDLDDYFAHAPANETRSLMLFDLDGFKIYNDMFGHLAGDDLLSRMGARLAEALGPWGTVYRLGGDEFCALVSCGEGELTVVEAAAQAALSERGEGFKISASYGVVVLRTEADTALRALQVADQRMYANKDGRRASPRSQMRDLLLRVLAEHKPGLNHHSSGVGALALAVGAALGMNERELDDVSRAADLHDLGKVAIPREILDKPGPLNPEEWAFMQRHTIIGDRILSAAPALSGVARLVRASHERWDGDGYPDALAGEAIPLGARVIAACDAFDAMTSERSYQVARSRQSALAELRRCAGTQFDPRVVDVLCEHIETGAAHSADEARAFDDLPSPMDTPTWNILGHEPDAVS